MPIQNYFINLETEWIIIQVRNNELKFNGYDRKDQIFGC
jgi:hypothetical protein